jgi:ATP-dependent DNA helicase 2 subunit 2
MAAPRVKTVKPVRLFAGKLTLGDPESKEKMIEIDVERYPRTHVAKAPSASSFTLRSDVSNGTQASQASFFMPSGGTSAGADDAAPSTSNLVLVRNDRKYQVDDPGAPGGKRLVEREELAKGYEYGRTAVHLTESDENVTKLATRPGLQIVGFVPRQKVCSGRCSSCHPHFRFGRECISPLVFFQYQRYFDMSVACVIVAGKVNNRASMALSSLIHALFELDSYAVARLVTKEDKPPLLVLLAPSIEEDYECLIDVQLPFAEDVRPYRFPPLDKILTVSGKVLTEHPNLPDKNLQAAMSDYVDRMDLSRFGKDDNG